MTHHREDQRHGSSPAAHARGLADEAAGAAHDVAAEARTAGEALRREAAGLGDSIKHGLTRQVERQKDSIADRISGIALRAEHSADELRDQEAWLAGLLGRGARELQGVADEIRSNDVADLLGSVEVFARRQPALFTGAAVALGFAFGRVVRGEGRPSYGQGRTLSYEAGGSTYELGSHDRPERLVSGGNA